MTYRWRGHVGPAWDLDKGLRTQHEVDAWIARDPITRLGAKLEQSGALPAAERVRVDEQVEAEVVEAIQFARSSPFPDPTTLLDNVYR
jgi:pyruvate dehydrogenase E1 component alpha subunit